MFTLTASETQNLISQNVTSSWGGTRKPARVFTEHGILSLSSVLKSEKAVQVNIVIMRTFVKLRQMITAHKELALKLTDLERRITKNDQEIQQILAYIRKILEPVFEDRTKRKIGFHS